MPIQRALTPKQRLILGNVARGRTNKEIAAELGVSEQAVKVHVSRLLERYGAANRVELVNITRTWPEADGAGLTDLVGDIAGIRAGLHQTSLDLNALATMPQAANGNGHAVAAPLRTNGHAAVTSDLVAEVRLLREVLTEINVALKLAREMPASADVGPIVDAIRARVGSALEQSARLDTLVQERGANRRPMQTAS